MCISRALREVHELITKLFVMNKHNIMTRLMTSNVVVQVPFECEEPAKQVS